MLLRPRRYILFAVLSVAWLFAVTAGAKAEEATAPQAQSTAAQASAAAVESFTEFLKAQAARAEEATKHDSDVIQHALTVFTWIVGVVGALLVAGAALLGWAMAVWSRASKTDIQKEVKTQLRDGVTEAIESQVKTTLMRVTELDKEVDVARVRVARAEDRLNQQRDTITNLVAWTMGSYPYAYLKDIYAKKQGLDSNKIFEFQAQTAFKRELGFLIDNGYIENINLDIFNDKQNIFDDLTITEAGKLYVTLRESLTAKPL